MSALYIAAIILVAALLFAAVERRSQRIHRLAIRLAMRNPRRGRSGNCKAIVAPRALRKQDMAPSKFLQKFAKHLPIELR